MLSQVRYTCRPTYMHITHISPVRHLLTKETVTTVHNYTIAKVSCLAAINTCWIILIGPKPQLPVLSPNLKRHHISTTLNCLQWLQVSARIQYKTLYFCFNSLSATAPMYPSCLLNINTSSMQLCLYVDTITLTISLIRSKPFGQCLFSHQSPIIWNKLPTVQAQIPWCNHGPPRSPILIAFGLTWDQKRAHLLISFGSEQLNSQTTGAMCQSDWKYFKWKRHTHTHTKSSLN